MNGLNQYTSVGPDTFGYDNNGNLTSDGTTTFGYDVENRLIAGGLATLTYDPMGRLNKVAMSSATETYLYAGDQRIAEYDGAGAMTARYVPGAGGDNPLLWYAGSSTTAPQALQGDERGSVVSVADASGALTQINSYDEFGIPAASNIGRYGYTGQLWVPQLGLWYYKARFYSPTLARFLQTDPIGYKDQNNLYAYVGNDPLNSRDPKGTDCSSNDGSTRCVTNNYDVTFKMPPQWKDPKSSDPKYHYYEKDAFSSKSVSETREWVKNNPTPGNPSPATSQGTRNDATPVLGGMFGRSGISPVISYKSVNAKDGQPVVINVTQPGHPLMSGIVVREVYRGQNGTSVIKNFGEGNGWLQRPGSYTGLIINDAWISVVPPETPPPFVPVIMP